MPRRPAALPTRALLLVLALGGSACSARRPGPAAETALGIRAAELGLFREAALRFERATRERPRDAALWNDLAVAREGEGRIAQALEAYRRAVGMAPGDARIRSNLDRFLALHGEALPPAAGTAGEDTP